MSEIPRESISDGSDSLGQFNREAVERDVLDRFVRYVAIHTTSDPHADATPSTLCQWDLIRLLADELRSLGLSDVTVTDEGYVVARLPGTVPAAAIVGFLAHVDTASDFGGEHVRPRIHAKYQGDAIKLTDDRSIDPSDSPQLLRYVGETVITSDGTTLLGADDKAGVAEIMSAVRYLVEHPEIRRGTVEVVFTPDEEIGRGMERFPRDLVSADFCYTMDGGEEGTIEAECFNAYAVDVAFSGRAIHPGYARGRLVNAVVMASTFVGLLPRNESPEATDGKLGYYMANEITATKESAQLRVFVRDFDREGVERRLAYLRQVARTVEEQFPGGTVLLSERKQYLNMHEALAERPEVMAFARAAVEGTGIPAHLCSIRGGTDGARLTEMGIPTPNIFCGAHNMHGPLEWTALPVMVRAVETILWIVILVADEAGRTPVGRDDQGDGDR